MAFALVGCASAPPQAQNGAPTCSPLATSVCRAQIGPITHECSDGAGHVCVLCSPAADYCIVDATRVCVLDCNECAQDPREKEYGITCSADPIAVVPPGPVSFIDGGV